MCQARGEEEEGGERDPGEATVTQGITGLSIFREAADSHSAEPSPTGADADPPATTSWGWASGS